MDKLRRPTAHVPKAHVLQMGAHHYCLGPREVNVINSGGAVCRCMLTGRDIPATYGSVVARGNKRFSVVVESHRSNKIRMTRVLLNPRRRFRSEQLYLVLVDRGSSNMLIIERGCDIEHSLIHPSHCLELPTGSCIPRFDEAVSTTCV